jgi:hypothetical protein
MRLKRLAGTCDLNNCPAVYVSDRGTLPIEFVEEPQRDLRWHGNVAAKIAEGKTMPRSKVVRRPLSDYTRFLFAWSVPENIRAGEEYRIVDLTDRHLESPSRDFWLFDDKVLLLLNFRADVTLINRILVEDEAELDQYRAWRDLAWENGMSVDEWNVGF